jgi:hypothetical protein
MIHSVKIEYFHLPGSNSSQLRLYPEGLHSIDFTGSESWKKYLSYSLLENLWRPHDSYPFAKSFKSKTISGIELASQDIKPRFTEEDKNCVAGMKRLLTMFPSILNNSAFVINTGPAHSVAMSMVLAEHGFQPVVMLDAEVVKQGYVPAINGLASLLYFSSHLEEMKRQNHVNAKSPPVFILDTHRHDNFLPNSFVDNTFSYSLMDFPSCGDLKKQNISTVIYIGEGYLKEGILHRRTWDFLPDDLRVTFQQWLQLGITMLFSGISPNHKYLE